MESVRRSICSLDLEYQILCASLRKNPLVRERHAAFLQAAAADRITQKQIAEHWEYIREHTRELYNRGLMK